MNKLYVNCKHLNQAVEDDEDLQCYSPRNQQNLVTGSYACNANTARSQPHSYDIMFCGREGVFFTPMDPTK